MSDTNDTGDKNDELIRTFEDIVRVLRLIEYVGPRSKVEETVRKAIHGTMVFDQGRQRITATTIGEFPEILIGPNVGRTE